MINVSIPVQPEKTLSPILVTLLGIVTDTMLVQPLKLGDILVMPSGIIKFVSRVLLIYRFLACSNGLLCISILSHPFTSPM